MDFSMETTGIPCRNQESVSHYILMGMCAVVHTMNYSVDPSAHGYEIRVAENNQHRKLRWVDMLWISPIERG